MNSVAVKPSIADPVPEAIAPEEGDESLSASRAWWSALPCRLIVVCGLVLIAVVVAATAGLLTNLRNRDLAEKEHVLDNLTLVLAEEIDRSFQAISLVQAAEDQRIKSLGIATEQEFVRQMSGPDTYQRLSAQAGILADIDAFVLTDREGNLLNGSRSWPAPHVTAPDHDPHEAFKADPGLTFLVGQPLRSPMNGDWEIPIARKLTGSTGDYLGVLIGVMQVRHFEQLFQNVVDSPHDTIGLLRRDGALLVRVPPYHGAAGRAFPHSRVVKLLGVTDHSFGREQGIIDGQERLVSARNVPHYPVAVVATATVADALMNWRRSAAITIFVAAVIGLLVGGVVFFSARHVGRKLREQNLQRDVALQNMSQGLAMFDAEARIVVCNERYRRLYDLPPDAVAPGRPLVEVLRHRIRYGSFHGNPDEFVADLRSRLAGGRTEKLILETADGRTVAIVDRPMPEGGWVTTHEDTTDQKRQEDSFLLLFNCNPMPMWVYDRDSLRFLAVNDAAIAHYGYSREQFRTMTPLDIRPIEESDRFLRSVRQAEAASDDEPVWRHRKSDGSEIEVVVYSRRLRYEGHSAVLVAVVDITEHRRAEQALAEASQELVEKQYTIDQALTVTITDVKGKITYANDNMSKISGYSREELLGADHRILKSGAHPAEFYRDMYRQIHSGRVWRGEICNKAKDGTLYWLDTTIVPQLGIDGKPRAFMAIRIDITARKLAEAKISFMASHDALTGLGNRALLNDELEGALARSRRRQETFAVLLLDLDGFKHVNDTLGHAAGDELLKELALRLRAALRETDILTRLGGDEFAIIQAAEKNQREAAITLSLRLLEIVAAPFGLGGQDVAVGTSIGIAVGPEDGDTAGDLLQKADLALYQVKADGRNNFRFFNQEMSRGAMARLSLLNDLRAGLGRREFALHYQLLFDAKTQRPCGAEALVRWRHPVEGLMPPDRFIPLAEEAGLIEPLGEWILERAFADAVTWPQDIKLAINLSAAQFRTGKLFDVILCALVESGLPPERLEFEITESVLLKDAENNVVILERLKNIGASIVLDDFGTGYSSLSYLTKFPFDKIKIDKSFTQGLAKRSDCAAVVASVLTLAHGLDIRLTAEGVETKEQFDLLAAVGVHEMQGYLFARPVPAAQLDFAALERKGHDAVAAA